MRDLAVAFYFTMMIALALKKPVIGFAIWIWTGFISLNFLVFGFATGIRFNFIAAVVTIISYAFYKQKPEITKSRLSNLVFFFLFWTVVSSFFAIYDSQVILREFNFFFRGIVLFLFALLLLDRKEHFALVCWAIVLSLGFHSGVEGLKFIATGGVHRIAGPGNTNLGDNNHLALAINMMIPFAIYLLSSIKNSFIRLCFIVFLVVTVLAVIGTFSRGGFIGLAILFAAWFIFSKRKVLLFFMLVMSATAVLSYVPDSYKDRINTINQADDDASLGGRIVAWKQSILIALDNPMTGGGFHAVQNRKVWERYIPEFDRLRWIKSIHAADLDPKAAHSIYFQTLGDHGFVGLFLFLSIFITAGLKALKFTKLKRLPDEYKWINQLSFACLLSLIAFAVGGGLLSMAYFELSYLVVAILCGLQKILIRERLL